MKRMHIFIKHHSKRKLFLLLLFPAGLILFWLTAAFPQVAEAYTEHIFRPLSAVMSNITGILPFSLAELSVISGVIVLIAAFIRVLRKAKKGFAAKRNAVINFGVNLVIIASVAYFAYVILWGIAYNRTQFSKLSGLDVSPATQTELASLCQNLITRANAIRSECPQDGSGVMKLSTNINDTIKRANSGYDKIVKQYPMLSGKYGDAKKILFSGAMSYTGVVGMYFPFTFEANVNTNNTAMDIPESICHEMAHQRGFAREDEANFIAFLVCINHPDHDFQYSGTVMAMIYSMDKLADVNRSKYDELWKTISPAILRDFGETRTYWEAHQGPVSNISQNVNDNYLKANNQKEGVQSYGEMTDLLIGWQRAGGKLVS